MKRILAFFLALLLCVTPALGVSGNSAYHSSYLGSDSVYGEAAYLYDTLTLAGSGMGSVQVLTVYDLEALAQNKSLGLGYENSYSLLTSGSVHSVHSFTGIKLYDLLVYCGLDESLPDSISIKTIAKDGYTITFTLGQLRKEYSRFASQGAGTTEETDLPTLIAFGSDGVPLVGPTGDGPVYQKFTETEGYDETTENIGGPMRLIMGQTASDEFNAPNCSKWLAAIVVGDVNGYVYDRTVSETSVNLEPEQGGDWTHDSTYADETLIISGSEALNTKLTLDELEHMSEGITREYYAASAGKNAYEGVTLRYLIEQYLADGISYPSKITVVGADGYRKELDVSDVMNGIDSRYQPGVHKDILLAYAVDGAPLVENADSVGYNGNNAYGPLRLVVENTISAWVKNVKEIIIGEENINDSILPSCTMNQGAFALMFCSTYGLSTTEDPVKAFIGMESIIRHNSEMNVSKMVQEFYQVLFHK